MSSFPQDESYHIFIIFLSSVPQVLLIVAVFHSNNFMDNFFYNSRHSFQVHQPGPITGCPDALFHLSDSAIPRTGPLSFAWQPSLSSRSPLSTRAGIPHLRCPGFGPGHAHSTLEGKGEEGADRKDVRRGCRTVRIGKKGRQRAPGAAPCV